MATTITSIRHGIPCARCGRLLFTETSKARGIGPECWEKALALQAERAGTTDLCDIPFAGDVVCRRDEENGYVLHVNIPMHDWETKQSGFEWGYSGTGPAAFALNILLHYGCQLEDLLVGGRYHDFKNFYVVTLPREGGTIPGDAIRAWIADHIPPPPPKLVQGLLFEEETHDAL